MNSTGSSNVYWKMYNDDETQFFPDWPSVLKKMLDMETKPTLIFYEKVYHTDKYVFNCMKISNYSAEKIHIFYKTGISYIRR